MLCSFIHRDIYCSGRKLPDLNDPEAVQRYFLQEIQLGEGLIAQGDIVNGVEHLANAIIVCGQPMQLLQVLQQTLPAEVSIIQSFYFEHAINKKIDLQVFAMLIQKMREFQPNEAPTGGLKLAEKIEDDLELE